MDELRKVDSLLSETIRSSDLQNISADISEAVIDSLFNDGVLKDIPIISSLLGIGKTAISIKNQLFLKKVLYFLSGIKHISI